MAIADSVALSFFLDASHTLPLSLPPFSLSFLFLLSPLLLDIQAASVLRLGD